MNIYALSVVSDMLTPRGADSADFSEWIDKHGFVILADSEADARKIAADEIDGSGPWWLNDKLTTCELIDLTGPARVIMANEPTG